MTKPFILSIFVMIVGPRLMIISEVGGACNGKSPFEGHWACDSITVLKASSGLNYAGLELIVMDGKCEYWSRDQDDPRNATLIVTGDIKVDSSKNPAELTVKLNWPKKPPQERLAIYKIENNVLTICEGEGVRPTRFACDGEPGSGTYLVVYKPYKR